MKYQFHFLSYVDDILVVCVSRHFFDLLSYERKMLFQIFVSKVYRSVVFEK